MPKSNATEEQRRTRNRRAFLRKAPVVAIADVAVLRLEKGKFGLTDMYGARMDSTQRLMCELTVKDGKIVYDLNGISRPDWKTLPAGYGPIGDGRWDGLNPVPGQGQGAGQGTQTPRRQQ